MGAALSVAPVALKSRQKAPRKNCDEHCQSSSWRISRRRDAGRNDDQIVMMGTSCPFSLWLCRADPHRLADRWPLHQSHFLYIPDEDRGCFLYHDSVWLATVLSLAEPGSH